MTQAAVEGGIAELARRRTIASGLGGPERVQRQHDRGFLTARERVDLLLDPGTAVPFGPLVNSGVPGEEHRTMGDGHLMGFGKVDGRWVAYSASDATIKGASGGAGSMRRGGAFERIAGAVPQIGLMQGGGARIRRRARRLPDRPSCRAAGPASPTPSSPSPLSLGASPVRTGDPPRAHLPRPFTRASWTGARAAARCWLDGHTAVRMGNYYAGPGASPIEEASSVSTGGALDKDAFIEWPPSADRAGSVIQTRTPSNSEPWLAAQLDFLDDVIDPAATRPILVRALATARARVRNSERHRGWERPHA